MAVFDEGICMGFQVSYNNIGIKHDFLYIYMYMYKCCIFMVFNAYWNFQINHLSKSTADAN